MIIAPRKRPDRTEENILPLINIVFLLLIFFMLAGALNVQPPFSVEPPQTSHADETVPEPEPLFIAADGRLAWGSAPIGRSELQVLIEARLPKAADAPLQIKADAGLPANDLADLLVDLRAAGIAEVRLVTVHGEQP